MIELVPLQYYTIVFYWAMFAICVLTGLYYLTAPGREKLLRQNSILLPLILTILLIIYIGLRPISGKYFGDMIMYRHAWSITDVKSAVYLFDFKSEWFYLFTLKFCKLLVSNPQFWFFIIDVIYIGFQFWACKRLLWENVWLTIMFVYFSFQFFSFGTNGLRNGMGCAIMMAAISFFCEKNRKGYVIGFFLFLLAMGCHRSVMVPMAALLLSLFVVKGIKPALFIWGVCIILSLFAGSYFQVLFGNLGFDVRMSNYSTLAERTMAQFSRTGFRWDFLLYSAVPVWFAWYVMDKGKEDRTFTILANTYIIANSFWVLVCRIAYSNRFAYLSWFLYALVIAYAVVRLPVWRNQDRVAGWVLLGHSAFTFIMFYIIRL